MIPTPPDELRDRRYLQRAYAFGLTLSRDASRKVGCLIVDSARDVELSWGINRFPAGVDSGPPERNERPAKYAWTEHAERNAIYFAARYGVSLRGATAYIPWFPCVDCARGLIEVGIGAVVVSQRPDLNDPTFGPGFAIAEQMFNEAGVILRVWEGAVPVQERKP